MTEQDGNGAGAQFAFSFSAPSLRQPFAASLPPKARVLESPAKPAFRRVRARRDPSRRIRGHLHAARR